MKNFIKGIFAFIFFLYATVGLGQSITHSKQFKDEFLKRINHTRQTGCNCGSTYMPPAPPLVWNNQLEIAAFGHAKDMSRKNYFSHTAQDGKSMQQRIVLAGYNFRGYRSFTVGENIAQGQQNIAVVMQGWFKSEGHCKNLMNAAFKEVGVAAYNLYWVQDFGGRDPFSPEQQKLIKSGRYRLIKED